MRFGKYIIVGGLLVLDACGPRSGARPQASSGAGASGSEGADTGPQTPEQLDARYRTVARHLARSPVWDSPLRMLSSDGLAVLQQYAQSQIGRAHV